MLCIPSPYALLCYLLSCLTRRQVSYVRLVLNVPYVSYVPCVSYVLYFSCVPLCCKYTMCVPFAKCLTCPTRFSCSCALVNFEHSHDKRCYSLETRVVLLIFLLVLEISGVVVQFINQNSEKWWPLSGIAQRRCL